jgi:hypothetical protein
MTVGPAGVHPRTSSKGQAIGVAASALAGLVVLLLVFPGLSLPRFSVPSQFSLPIELPPLFWLFLLLVLALGIVTHAVLKERERLRRWSGSPEDVPLGGDSDAGTYDSIEDLLSGAAGDEAIVLRSGAFAAAPGARVATEGELPRLIEWIDGVAAKIKEWSVDFTGGHDAPSRAGEGIEDPSYPTTKTAVPKVVAWTELRARAAIGKYLRTRPWAPAMDIAKALGMDVGLATRITDALRDEGVR